MNKRDYVYYDYKFENIKPKNILQKIYCIIRKTITVNESPSKVLIYKIARAKAEYILNKIKED